MSLPAQVIATLSNLRIAHGFLAAARAKWDFVTAANIEAQILDIRAHLKGLIDQMGVERKAY